MSYKMIFVFGSNLAGRHGAGAAATAKKHYGAINGQGIGRQGNSYAIPTKDENLASIPLHIIHGHVDVFLDYAREHYDERFYVTRIGCGLAGYHSWEIAPMFMTAPKNCLLHEEWVRMISQLGLPKSGYNLLRSV